MGRKYNVIFMRDDSNVRRMRLSSFWLKFVGVAVLLLVSIASVGIYASYTLLQQNKVLLDERSMLNKRVQDTRVQLERLQNMERILKSNDPKELQAYVSSVQEDGDADAVEDEGDAQQNSAQESDDTGKSDSNDAEASQNDVSEARIDLNDLFKQVDLALAEITKFNLSAEDRDTLNVRFVLNNLDNDRVLSGTVELSLITTEGALAPLEVVSEDLAFQIQRFKTIKATFDLPESAPLESVFALRVAIINDGGKTILSKHFPLASHLS